jgi:hypothetical protein
MTGKKQGIASKKNDEPKSKYDSAWKKVIKKLFKDFLEFFYPEIYRAIDFTKEITFLDNELKEIIPDSNLGDRVADVLVKVHLRDGQATYICIIIHIEVQGDPQSDFMHRMFIYYYRIFDKEVEKKIPVISVAMLTDDNASFRRDVYESKLLGFEIRMKIPVVKILDYKLNKELKEKLETSTNPMSMIVRAQLKSLEIKKADANTKFEVTKELIRECYRFGYSRGDTRIIMHFFAWAIRLPASLKNRIRSEIKKVEEELKMEYIPLWERDSHEEGVKIGVKEGKKVGVKEGAKDKAIEIAKKSLEEGLPIELIVKLTGLSKEEIEKL